MTSSEFHYPKILSFAVIFSVLPISYKKEEGIFRVWRISLAKNNAIKNQVTLYFKSTTARALAQTTYHSTGADAARVAQKVEVGKLIIGHFSARYKDHKTILKEATAIFQNTEAISEVQVFLVEAKSQ